jgi:hypothetical protein
MQYALGCLHEVLNLSPSRRFEVHFSASSERIILGDGLGWVKEIAMVYFEVPSYAC